MKKELTLHLSCENGFVGNFFQSKSCDQIYMSLLENELETYIYNIHQSKTNNSIKRTEILNTKINNEDILVSILLRKKLDKIQ